MRKLYCIPEIEYLDQYVKLAEENNWAFEYNDFFIPAILDNPDEIEKRINVYKATGRDMSQDSLHGVFFDICVNSSDSLIKAASDKRVRQSMDIAKRLGVAKVIFHTNYITNFHAKSYEDSWVEDNAKYWTGIIKDYPGITICIENMFDEYPELLARLADKMSGEKRFGVCFDWAHAFLGREEMDGWCRALGDYVYHIHINDNDGIADDHKPVGAGVIDWSEFNKFIKGFSEDERPSVLVEVKGLNKLGESINYMREKGIYPF